MTNSPRHCAAVLIQESSDKVLFVRQAYGQRFWGIPGGIVDAGETPLEAAQREAMEEIDTQVQLTGLVGCYLLTGSGWSDIQAYVFKGEVIGGIPKIVNPREISEVLWLSSAGHLDPLLPDVRAALEDIRAGKMGVVRTVERTVPMHDVSL